MEETMNGQMEAKSDREMMMDKWKGGCIVG